MIYSWHPATSRTKEIDVNPQAFAPSKTIIECVRRAIARTYRSIPSGTWITIYLRNATIIASFPHKIERENDGSTVIYCKEKIWDRAWKIVVPADPESKWFVSPA